jgi:hypothetical protein
VKGAYSIIVASTAGFTGGQTVLLDELSGASCLDRALRGERQRLAERVSLLQIESRVEFLGWQSQDRCAELLSRADVMVLSNVFDPGATVVMKLARRLDAIEHRSADTRGGFTPSVTRNLTQALAS